MFKFLIDECLSPTLASLGKSRGHSSFHVNWLDLNGYRDQSISVYSVSEDFVFVTNNGVDFKPIYRSLDVHPGLVIILPSVKRADQQTMFLAVLERISSERDLINKLIEIDLDGVISISEFPPFRDNI